MNTVLIIAFVLAVAVVAFNIWIHLPPKGTLNQLKPSKWFHGLILFGKDGAYIELDQLSTNDNIFFTKRYMEKNGWRLEVVVRGEKVLDGFLDLVKGGLAPLGERFKVEDCSSESSGQVKCFLTGTGLKDHYALESVARLFIKHLGHAANAKYRLMFLGPKDYKAADNYYSDLMKQWRK